MLYKEKSTLWLKKAAELTNTMYQITYTLPESKYTKTKLLKMDDQQAELYRSDKQYSPISAIASLYYLFDTIGV